jgi:ABC-type nitrate/sulfonate/bicarbonate transport system substrate-binding protein
MFLLFCSGALLTFTSCSPSEPPVVIRAGVTHSVDILPYLVMKERSHDPAQGFRLQEQLYTGAAAIVDAMAKGEVDLGISMGSVVIIDLAGRGLIPSLVTPVASESVCDLQHPGMGLLVSNSITGFKGLEGRFVATSSRNSLGGIMIAGRLKKEGVTTYTIVEIPFANQGLAVAGGNVAGATLVEPYLTQSLRRGDGHLLDWLTGKPPFERMPYTMICFRTGFLKANPGAVGKYLSAYLKAVDWIRNHTREARSILAGSLSIDEDVAQNMYLPEWPADGRNDPALLLPLESEMKDLGLINTVLPPEKLYDETLLDNVLSGQGSRK